MPSTHGNFRTFSAVRLLCGITAAAVVIDGPCHGQAADPSDPVLAAPVGSGHRVIKHPCACGWTPGPFFNRRCVDPPCMAAIGIDEVVDTVEMQLAARSSQ